MATVDNQGNDIQPALCAKDNNIIGLWRAENHSSEFRALPLVIVLRHRPIVLK